MMMLIDTCEFNKKECRGDPGDHEECEIITSSDLNCTDIARKVWNKYQEFTGKRPHLIIRKVSME